jgi:hypothetical protein
VHEVALVRRRRAAAEHRRGEEVAAQLLVVREAAGGEDDGLAGAEALAVRGHADDHAVAVDDDALDAVLVEDGDAEAVGRLEQVAGEDVALAHLAVAAVDLQRAAVRHLRLRDRRVVVGDRGRVERADRAHLGVRVVRDGGVVVDGREGGELPLGEAVPLAAGVVALGSREARRVAEEGLAVVRLPVLAHRRVVRDPVPGGRLAHRAAGLARLLEHQRARAVTGRVERGREARGARSDDDDVVRLVPACVVGFGDAAASRHGCSPRRRGC